MSSNGSQQRHTMSMSMMQPGDTNPGDFLEQSRNQSVKSVTKSKEYVQRESKSFKSNNFRASNALQSIQSFQETNRDSMKRASLNLGLDASNSGDTGEIKIENERLKTTLMILN